MPGVKKAAQKQEKGANRRPRARALVSRKALEKDRARVIVRTLGSVLLMAKSFKLDRDFNGSEFMAELKAAVKVIRLDWGIE